jgi:hypothetical protein
MHLASGYLEGNSRYCVGFVLQARRGTWLTPHGRAPDGWMILHPASPRKIRNRSSAGFDSHVDVSQDQTPSFSTWKADHWIIGCGVWVRRCVCSSYLLIRQAQRARSQAETPPILPSRFPEPALDAIEAGEPIALIRASGPTPSLCSLRRSYEKRGRASPKLD